MAILDILEFPDPRLRTVAKPVEVVDDKIKQLVADMFDTMRDAQGIGLAASQVDVHLRVIVMDLGEEDSSPRVFINPEIEVLDQDMAPYDEAASQCLHETIDRPAHVMIRALDGEGNALEEAHGLLAVTFSMRSTISRVNCLWIISPPLSASASAKSWKKSTAREHRTISA